MSLTEDVPNMMSCTSHQHLQPLCSYFEVNHQGPMCGVTQRDVVKVPSIYITTNFKRGKGDFYYINFESSVDQDEVG